MRGNDRGNLELTSWWRLFWQVPSATLIFVIGVGLGGGLAMALKLAAPKTPTSAPWQMVVSFMIVVCATMLLARQLSGSWAARAGTLWLFVLFVHSVNTAIEASLFTDVGGGLFLATMGLIASAALGMFAATISHGVRHEPVPSIGSNSKATLLSATLRIVVAVAAFPIIYFVFGMAVTPFVMDAYREPNSYGLHIPTMGTVILVQLLRSALFLIPSWMVIKLWGGSRAALLINLAIAHWCLVGLAGLAVPGILPANLRLAHSLEIGADSIAYAGVLIVLFPKRRSAGRDIAGSIAPTTSPIAA